MNQGQGMQKNNSMPDIYPEQDSSTYTMPEGTSSYSLAQSVINITGLPDQKKPETFHANQKSENQSSEKM